MTNIFSNYADNNNPLGIQQHRWREIQEKIPFNVAEITESPTELHKRKITFHGIVNDRVVQFHINISHHMMTESEDKLKREIIRQIKDINFDEITKELI